MECLVTRVRGSHGRGRTRCEGLLKVPQEVEIPVQIHADRVRDSLGRRLGVAVLAPAAVGCLVVGHAVGVGQGDEDQTGRERLLDVGSRVGLAAVGDADVVLISIQQVRDEVQQAVGGATLAGVDGGVDEDAVGVAARAVGAADPAAKDGAALVRLERGVEGLEAVGRGQSLEAALDLLYAQERAVGGAGGPGAETAGDDGAAPEAVAGSHGDAVVARGLAAADQPARRAGALLGQQARRGQERGRGGGGGGEGGGQLHGCEVHSTAWQEAEGRLEASEQSGPGAWCAVPWLLGWRLKGASSGLGLEAKTEAFLSATRPSSRAPAATPGPDLGGRRLSLIAGRSFSEIDGGRVNARLDATQ